MLATITNKMPSKLKVEPLVEAVFEIRFQANTDLSSNVLLGHFLSKLGKLPLTKLGASEIPQQIREQNPNFKYSPLFRASWGDFFLLIGDSMFAITTKLPYPGWDKFKHKILTAINHLKESDIISNIERYALKYVDIVEADSIQSQLELINLHLSLGSHEIKKEPINLRAELNKDDFSHIVQVITDGVLEENEKTVKKGVLLNIDSIEKKPNNDFWASLPHNLDKIHTSNKAIFFSLLKAETIAALGPVYE